jgi:hypothetical protein
MRSGNHGVPTTIEWLNDVLPSGCRVGIDPVSFCFLLCYISGYTNYYQIYSAKCLCFMPCQLMMPCSSNLFLLQMLLFHAVSGVIILTWCKDVISETIFD